MSQSKTRRKEWERVVGKIYGTKYSRKGHKAGNRHKNRIKRSGHARLAYVWDINHNIPTTKRWASRDNTYKCENVFIYDMGQGSIVQQEKKTIVQFSSQRIIPATARQHRLEFGKQIWRIILGQAS